MAKEVLSNSTTYYKVDSDGYIYLTSKVEKEGYKEYTNKDGVFAGYKKIYQGTDDGYISYIGIRKAEFPTGVVELVSVSIDTGNGIENVQFPLLNTKGFLSPYAKALAQVLPNVDFKERHSVSFDKRKDEMGYTIKNVYLNRSDVEGTPAVAIFHKFKKKDDDSSGDIPRMVPKTGLGGKVTWDSTEQDNYLYDSLVKQIERFAEFKGSSPKVSNVVNEVVKEEVVQEEASDDLPF